MATTSNDDEIKIKPAITSLECEEMLNEALKYIAKNSLKQAGIMYNHFKQILKILEKQPGIGMNNPAAETAGYQISQKA